MGTVGENLSGTVEGLLLKYRQPGEEATATPTTRRDQQCTVTTTAKWRFELMFPGDRTA